MTTPETATFGRKTLDELTIEDDRSFAHIELYGDLKEIVRREKYAFRTLPEGGASWDRALFLNLTFWGANEAGDVLVESRVPADVVAHVAWHRLAANALGHSASGKPTAEALFLGEAIASAFDLYLVGRVLGHAPKSSFLRTQVPALAEAASSAGLDEEGFEKLLFELADNPERSFGRLRELLSDATEALFASKNAEGALVALSKLESHPYAPLLHRYELANWILYARAYGVDEPSPKAREVERALREAEDPLQWLTENWVRPALG